jgi:hypothetical protein
MHCPNMNRLCGAILLAALVMASTPGCHNGEQCRSCNDITPGAIPQPNGTYDCQWIHAEKARADQDKFVIYHYEWSADATKLTPSGQEHVAQIARGLCQAPCPVVIEPSLDRGLDEARRRAVLEALACYGGPVSPDRVTFGRPEAEGLYGQEAPGIAARMLTSQTGGQAAGGGALGAGTAQGGIGSVGTSPGVGVGVGVGMGMGTY